MIAPARRAALDALALIDDGAMDFGAAVAHVRNTLSDDRDRALLLELVGGTLRMQGAIDYQLSHYQRRAIEPAVMRVLRLGAYQLLYLSRLPPAAVINDAVELTRRSGKSSAAGLTNAILRALSRDRDRLRWPDRTAPVEYLSAVHSHPQWLVERWLSRYGADATEAWLTFNNRAPAICLAISRHRTARGSLTRALTEHGVVTKPTSRALHGLEVIEGNALSTAAFAEGLFVVQDEASQLITELAGSQPGDVVLDLCASPGGKTLALTADVAPDGRVIACDVRMKRVRLLQRTLARCRVPNSIVMLIPADGALPFQADSFDRVLIDAPCSGLGTVRRDPDIKWRRTPADLARFAAAQRQLLARAADLVKRGGTLVYATCSSEPEENDDVVTAFLGERSDFSLVQRHQTLPFRDGLEAFFGAVLRRSTIG